jgi:hypothetical protein
VPRGGCGEVRKNKEILALDDRINAPDFQSRNFSQENDNRTIHRRGAAVPPSRRTQHGAEQTSTRETSNLYATFVSPHATSNHAGWSRRRVPLAQVRPEDNQGRPVPAQLLPLHGGDLPGAQARGGRPHAGREGRERGGRRFEPGCRQLATANHGGVINWRACVPIQGCHSRASLVLLQAQDHFGWHRLVFLLTANERGEECETLHAAGIHDVRGRAQPRAPRRGVHRARAQDG